MLKFLAGFFRENAPESMTRLGAFLLILAAISLGYIVVIGYFYYGKDCIAGVTCLIGVYLSYAGLTKIIQKKDEIKNDKTPNNL